MDNYNRKLNSRGETLNTPEAEPSPIHHPEHPDNNPENDRQLESLEAIRHTIEHQALSKETTPVETAAEQANSDYIPHYITKHIKAEHYQITLNLIRRHLSPVQQKFSRLVHQPMVETASEIGSKTIARPSGLLGGGLLSLTGSLTITIIARRVGFTLPSSLFAILFIIGFVVGVIIEFVLHHTSGTKNLTD